MEENLKGIPVLFENNFCMVLNKPAGLAVQGGEGIGVSLDSMCLQTKDTAGPGARPLLVHRLDRDTSGIILVAKDREAAAAFSNIFGGKSPYGSGPALKPVKQYLAICKGIPNPPNGIIRLDLEIRGQKKKSKTSYRMLQSFKTMPPHFSLLELEPGTGRMHQIRRHLMMINHPILGDDKYGDFSLNKTLRKTLGLKKLLLHASRLIIPRFRLLPQGLDISAEPPEYFSECRDLLAAGGC